VTYGVRSSSKNKGSFWSSLEESIRNLEVMNFNVLIHFTLFRDIYQKNKKKDRMEN
jgi:hypothetical protein